MALPDHHSTRLNMTRFATRPLRFTLAALAIAGLAAAAVLTPARAMVERGTMPGSERHAATSDAAKPSGVISIQVVSGLNGPPPPAARFYGSAGSAPNGATITAVSSNQATCGSAAVAGSSYSLDITSTDASCTSAGSAMHFLINGKSVHSGGGAIPAVSSAVHSDLSAP
jgi:hypothetical protein